MNIQWLRGHVTHLRERLIRFEQMHEQLHIFYQQSCIHSQSQTALSNLMEHYFIHLDRQQRAIIRMTALYQKACNQLAALESAHS